MRYALTSVLAAALFLIWPSSSSAQSGQTRGPVVFSCAGPLAKEGREIARANELRVGLDPNACFGAMSIYGPPDREIVVAAPSPKCGKAKLIDIYGQSRAGGWYSYFAEPICGADVRVGPKNPWGDWMISVDGRNYDNRGGVYILVK